MTRVLIVDDEAPIRRILRKWLEAEGASVVEAGTAEEALREMAKLDVPAGIALCDVLLPGKDGLWLVEQLDTLYPDTAILMTTALHDFDTAVTSLRLGAVDYVVKPFTREALIEGYRRAFFVHTSRESVGELTREDEVRWR